jgi:glycyl-tRNA synthetase beta chain
MPELLLEILSEEIPARMQARAAEDLRRLVVEGLDKAGLENAGAQSYVTPRRLVLVVDGIPAKQPDLREERRGPRNDAPDKAIQGFLGSIGLDSIDQCEARETPKGTFLFAVIERKGLASADVLPGLVTEAIAKMPWPKSMRWADMGFRWVRPLHSVLALFDGKPLDGAIDLQGANLAMTDTTVGHRFHAPAEIKVKSFRQYRDKLEKAKVIIDPAVRRARIQDGLTELAAAENLTVREDPALLDEVSGLVEWPVALIGEIDDAFMDVPHEVLTSSMRTHQKYFSLLDKDGALAPRFGMVANIETADGGGRIVAGNERVLRARLADAKFFWDQDCKESLASRVPQLEHIVFHAKLGTLDHKVDRLQALAVLLAPHVPGADRDRVGSAARLCKADLVTGMVGEFPELQGVMGRYYALNDGEHPEVAAAIAGHYSPLGPNDECPTAPVSVCVALADKIDTLAGFFAIDEKPTGSRDPYGLRRAALGVIRLVRENDLRLSLGDVFQAAITGYLNQDNAAVRAGIEADAKAGSANGKGDRGHAVRGRILGDLLEFFADRLKVSLREHGVRHDLISAIFAVDRPGGGTEDDLVRLLARVDALEKFLGADDGANLLVAYKRAANIVRIEEKKDKADYTGGVNKNAFVQKEEAALFAALEKVSALANASLEKEEFSAAMRAMAGLRKPVDDFFEGVTVNIDDGALRENRLRLLSAISETLRHAADFSKIEG